MGGFAGGEEDSEAAGQDELRLADALLLGRKTYEGLAAYWPKETGVLADLVNDIPKFVASTSLVEPLEWNAPLVKGRLRRGGTPAQGRPQRHPAELRLRRARLQPGKAGLVEDVHSWVHPIVWSEPSRPFHGFGHVRMKCKDTTVFDSGVTLHNYEPVSVEE